MTRSCCALFCTNQSKDGWKMFNIPRGSHPFHKNRRRLWLQAIQRDWGSSGPNDESLCSAHFISGAPSMDYDSPDFVPSIFSHNTRDNTAKVARYNRKRRWDENKGPLTRLDENIAPVPSPTGDENIAPVPSHTGQMETDPLESPEDSVESRLQVQMNSPVPARPISMKQEEPEYYPGLKPPHIKEEPDGSLLTLLAVKKEDDDDDISSHCFEIEVELESDAEVTEDSDEWEESSGEPQRSTSTAKC